MANEPVVPEAEKPGGRVPLGKIVIAVVVIAALIVAIRLLPTDEWLRALQTYVKGLGAVGWIVYALVYAVCCVLFVPASLLTLGAGVIFGLVEGTIVVVAGATLGAVASFLLARTVMRSKVESMTAGNPKFRALDRAIGKEGAKIVFLIRLSPLFPFTYINYGFGLTGVRTLPYAFATLLGIIPGTFAFVYIGSLLATAAGDASTTQKIIRVAGLAITIVVTLLVTRIARNAMKSTGLDDAPPTADAAAGEPRA
jgi:uncharacterized membrane protein YdjX (TVP38/TMEM64 family)